MRSESRYERAECKEPRSESPRHIKVDRRGVSLGSDAAIRSRSRFFGTHD